MLNANVCPLTMGAPTSMTDSGFKRSCRMRNKDQAIRNGYGFAVGTSTIYDAHCEQCGGEYPPELTIIKIEEISMVRTQGSCEVCGKEKSMRAPVDGKMCCHTCEPIRRNAKLRGSLMLEQIREFHPKLLSLPADSEREKTLEGVIKILEDDCKRLEQMVKDLRESDGNLQTERLEMLDSLDAMKGENSRYGQRIMAIEENIDFISDQRNEALKENLSLIQEIEQLKKKPTIDATTETQMAIADTCDDIRDMLIAKNQSYGNSALEPIRLFSKASPREQILVRLDDKLSLLSRGNEYPGDNTIKDLIGYLVLLLVQEDSVLGEVA